MSAPENKNLGPARTDLLHILLLWSFAVAQPLYDMFAQYNDFFVAHDARPLDLFLLAGVLSFGPPIILMAIVYL